MSIVSSSNCAFENKKSDGDGVDSDGDDADLDDVDKLAVYRRRGMAIKASFVFPMHH